MSHSLIRRSGRKLISWSLSIHPFLFNRIDRWDNETHPKREGPLSVKKDFFRLLTKHHELTLMPGFSSFTVFPWTTSRKSRFCYYPKSTESLLLERSILSFRDRVHLLKCGYESVAETLTTQFNEIHKLCHRQPYSHFPPKYEQTDK